MIKGDILRKLTLIEVNIKKPIELANETRIEELELFDTKYFHHVAFEKSL